MMARKKRPKHKARNKRCDKVSMNSSQSHFNYRGLTGELMSSANILIAIATELMIIVIKINRCQRSKHAK